MPQIGYAHRQAPMGRDGMVASCHPLASLAGVEVLNPAAMWWTPPSPPTPCSPSPSPTTAAWAATSSASTTRRPTRKVHFLNGAGRSGSRATLDELGAPRPGRACRRTAPASVSVPGVTRAWRMLLERFGTRPLGTCSSRPSTTRAEGFPITDIVCQAIRERAPGNRRSRVAARLHARRRVPAVGRVLPPARPGPHAERPGRRSRALLPRAGGARHRRPPRAPTAS